jgi:hypothetical protein
MIIANRLGAHLAPLARYRGRTIGHQPPQIADW